MSLASQAREFFSCRNNKPAKGKYQQFRYDDYERSVEY